MSEHQGWVRQLFIIWLVQLISIAGFCFGLPFAAYYIQELGITEERDVLWWTTAFAVTAPLCFSIASPFWGVMADRYGRKRMLYRASICAALVLFGMGWSPNVYWLLVFRVGQGLFTGVVPAAQTLLAVSTPGHRQGMALGSLAAAVAGGIGLGSALGGRIAEVYGYSTAFYIGGCLSILACLLIKFGAVEKHEAESERISRAASGSVFRLVLPVLGLMAVCSIMSNVDNATLALFVQELNNGELDGAARAVGDIFAISGVAFATGGLVWGWLGDRFGQYTVLSICVLLAALASYPMTAVTSIPPLYVIVLCFALCMAGIDPILQALLSKETPAERRGSVFGWAGAARSIGWMAGPFIGSLCAQYSGYAAVYWIRVALAASMLPMIIWTLFLMRTVKQPTVRQHAGINP